MLTCVTGDGLPLGVHARQHLSSLVSIPLHGLNHYNIPGHLQVSRCHIANVLSVCKVTYVQWSLIEMQT